MRDLSRSASGGAADSGPARWPAVRSWHDADPGRQGEDREERTLLLDALVRALRSPLTTISGFAEVLRRPDSSRLSYDDRDKALAYIAASSRRIELLAANVEDLARVDAGTYVVVQSRTSLAEMIVKVLDGLDLAGHPLELSAEDSVVPIDEFLVGRIVENLVANAAAHTPAGTPVRVEVRPAGSGVELVVADEGPGVPDELRDVMFERFRHRDAPYTGSGAGLGLYLVRRLAELHGGRAWLEQGDGAEFHVFLETEEVIDLTSPRTPSAAVPPAAAPGDAVPVGFLMADDTGRVVEVNQAWMDLSRLSRADSLGEGWLRAVSVADRPRLLAQIGSVADLGRATGNDYQITAGSTRCWTRWWFRANGRSDRRPVGIAVADVEVDHAREAELRHFATHDALTGLSNRTQFFEFAEQALRRLGRAAGQIGVVFVDLEGFKAVNDNGGHSAGDRVLVAVGERLRRAVRPADVVARIGGDEFAVLCEDINDTDCAQIVAERIGREFSEDLEVEGVTWQVRPTVGVATTCRPDDTADALLDRADRAMYEARAARG